MPLKLRNYALFALFCLWGARAIFGADGQTFDLSRLEGKVDLSQTSSIILTSQNKMLSEMDRQSLKQLGKSSKKSRSTSSFWSFFAARKDKFFVLHMEFESKKFCQNFSQKEITVFDRFDKFASAFINLKDIEKAAGQLDRTKGLVLVEIAGTVEVPPPPVNKGEKVTSRATPEKIVSGGIDGLTGKGVIVAIIDTGIDFRHADFIQKDTKGIPTSRIKYLWDMTSKETGNSSKLRGKPGPIQFPNGNAAGRLYSQADLTAELQSSKKLIGSCDNEGHGTNCAGVAAGNGNASAGKYAGVAPQADIIGVRLGDDLEMGSLLPAVLTWLEKVAGDRPMVISCSFGGQHGGRDGHMIEERRISAQFKPDRKGRAICIAAGNEGTDEFHAGVKFEGRTKAGRFSWDSPTGAMMEFYIQTDKPRDIKFLPLGNKHVKIRSAKVNPLTKHIALRVFAGPGKGVLLIYSDSGKGCQTDAYIHGPGAKFSPRITSSEKIVGTPGTAINAITVGSYDWNDRFETKTSKLTLKGAASEKPLEIGQLSAYSSRGGMRFGDAIKPEITAPGQWHIAPASNATIGMRDTTGQYSLFNGTSAATPYTAGVIALLMEINPKITNGEIKKLIKSSATTDAFTGKVPNAGWGHGKLDVAAVKKMIEAVRKKIKDSAEKVSKTETTKK